MVALQQKTALHLIWLFLSALLPGFVLSQSQFTQPNGNLNDFSQTFSVGSAVQLAWKAGWNGYGQDPGYADLFVVSFETDAYVALVFANKSTAEGGMFSWRVNIPEDSVKSENGKFVFKFVKALNPPNYAGANPAATLSPSRGFNIRLASAASSAAASSATSSATSAVSSTVSIGSSTSSVSSSTPATNPTSSSTATPESKSSVPIGAVVGGVVGGVAALMVILYLLIRLRQVKKAHAASEAGGLQHSSSTAGFAQEPIYYKATGQLPYELSGVSAPVEADNHYTKVHEK